MHMKYMENPACRALVNSGPLPSLPVHKSISDKFWQANIECGRSTQR